MHLAENVGRISEHFIALELRLEPIGRALLNLERIVIPEIVAKTIHHFPEHAVGFAFVHFKRADLVDHVVDHIAEMHSVQHSEAEINCEFQTGLAGGSLNPVAIFEEQDTKTVEAGVLQREAIFRLVHAEAARTAGTRGEEYEVVQDLFARQAFLLQKLKVLHEIAHGEVGGITLAVVAELLAGLKGRDVGNRQLFAAVAATLKDGTDQVFMLPGKAAKQNRDLIPFFGCERPLNGTVKMCGLVQTSDLAEPVALGLQALFDFFIIVDLNKIGRHYLPPAYAALKCLLESLDGKKVAFDAVAETAETEEAEVEVAEGRRPAPAIG
ncbi:MAG: hypothetical protein WAM13_10450 [Candidatus Sulfotelmatobacter sp.]